MKEFQQLMITDDGSITVEQKKFIDLHKEILYCGNLAAEYAIQMASKLKKMRDEKLYTAAGFNNFGDYVENAVGIKERQAYNYIKVYEELPKEFLQSNAKIGVTKLSLLASLPNDEREEIVENSDIESISVRELKERIKELEAKNEQLQLSFDEVSKNVDESILHALEDDLKRSKEESSKNLKSVTKLKNEKEKLEQEIERLKNQPKEVETIDNPETKIELEKTQEELKNKQNELNKKIAEIETLNKQLLASDGLMAKFKIKFEDLQRIGMDLVDLLKQLDVDKQDKCKMAIKTVIGGWNI